jgi:hypothetical protein
MSDKKKEQATVNPLVLKKPPFAGRYYIYNGKKYLFTHRHPYKQEFWSDDVKVGDHYGAWIATDKLKPA